MKRINVIIFLSIGFFNLARADEAKESVETLESKVSFSNKTLHKIEYGGAQGHEVHYFDVTASPPLYVCRKSCLEPNPEKLEKSIDIPSGSKTKHIRNLKVFSQLKDMCGQPTERPSIKTCAIANAPSINGYNELIKSL